MKRWAILTAVILISAGSAGAERIKDIVTIKGVRGNFVMGYGLVIGLGGTGDNSPASLRAMKSYLSNMENMVFRAGDLSSKNIASVIVTAELGPFDRVGDRIDITVSAIGNAKSLRGGQLLMAELKGADRQAYVHAQGAILIGGFSASGQNASITSGHVTVGRIPGGGLVEREERAKIVVNGEITLLLRNNDFGTASEVAKVINRIYPKSSRAVDAKGIRVALPEGVHKNRAMEFINRIGLLEVKVDTPAVVVINEKTGTVVVGRNVRISPVAISQGSLTIQVEETKKVVQPNPLGSGETKVISQTGIRSIEGASQFHVVPTQVSVADLVQALNAMGLTPTDLVSIFQALRVKGALQAELKII